MWPERRLAHPSPGGLCLPEPVPPGLAQGHPSRTLALSVGSLLHQGSFAPPPPSS